MVGTDFGEGSLTNSEYPRIVKEWKRGTALSEATKVFEGEKTDVSVSGYLVRHAGWEFEWRTRSLTFYTSIEQVRPEGSSTWTTLPFPEDTDCVQFLDQVLVSLRIDWSLKGEVYKSGALLSFPLHEVIAKGLDAEPTVLYAPTPRVSLESYTATKNYIILEYLDNVKSRLHFWRFSEGKWQDEGMEKEASIRGCSVSAVDSDETDEYWFTTSSFTQPSTLGLADAAKGPNSTIEPLKSLPAQFDATGHVEVQYEATSADGTKVPYFVVHKEGLKLDGECPTLMFGYGGFEISLTPAYIAVVGAAWLEAGGCFVQPNIRGGGEFGPSWHQAALKENRQKAYDDMIAVAEHLISTGITSTKRLAIRGGSNGGLLMGNMLVQRPDLFGAIVCCVPLLDMRRYHKLLAGASWMAEYGDPDTDDWEFLQKYSPYHNIDSKASYPPFLMTTSTRDDRVHPYHARCMVKRLLEVGNVQNGKLYYYENMEGGHGGAADSKQQAFMTYIYIEFLWQTIGKGLRP